MNNPKNTFIKSFAALGKSFLYAGNGIAFAVKSQRNARLHLAAAVLVCIAAWFLDVLAADWRWLIACIGLVWFAEMMNTAFEHLCDLIQPEHHLSVKQAKDIAAGAVLITSLTAALIGLLVFWPYIHSYIAKL